MRPNELRCCGGTAGPQQAQQQAQRHAPESSLARPSTTISCSRGTTTPTRDPTVRGGRPPAPCSPAPSSAVVRSALEKRVSALQRGTAHTA